MHKPLSYESIASRLLADKGFDLVSCSPLQSLWAGYGQIMRLTVSEKDQKSRHPGIAKDSAISTPKDVQTYILKLITPPAAGEETNEGHIRKVLSYQVEQYFYTHLATQLPRSVAVAGCLNSINETQSDGTSTNAMILEDLATVYPLAGEKRAALTPVQALSALDWLAGFHGYSWRSAVHLNRHHLVHAPLEQHTRSVEEQAVSSVWLNGGYTYLATRQTELAQLAGDDNSEWSQTLTQAVSGSDKSIAELVAIFLAPTVSGRSPTSGYHTLIHGDVKSENLFTSATGDAVAFYDFQYVGLGLGVSDLAKLFTCSVPIERLVPAPNSIPPVLEMQEGERTMLERYWKRLCSVSGRQYDWNLFKRHWEIALVDWLRFQASWGFWGNTKWLEARVRAILSQPKWVENLANDVNVGPNP